MTKINKGGWTIFLPKNQSIIHIKNCELLIDSFIINNKQNNEYDYIRCFLKENDPIMEKMLSLKCGWGIENNKKKLHKFVNSTLFKNHLIKNYLIPNYKKRG